LPGLTNKPQSEQAQAVAAYINEKTRKMQDKRREALQVLKVCLSLIGFICVTDHWLCCWFFFHSFDCLLLFTSFDLQFVQDDNFFGVPMPKEDDDDDDDNFVLVEEGDLALVPKAGKKKQSLSAKKKKFVKPVLAAKSFKVRNFLVVLRKTIVKF
jgi:hypothetical protein